jgi:hypothetical protein
MMTRGEPYSILPEVMIRELYMRRSFPDTSALYLGHILSKKEFYARVEVADLANVLVIV